MASLSGPPIPPFSELFWEALRKWERTRAFDSLQLPSLLDEIKRVDAADAARSLPSNIVADALLFAADAAGQQESTLDVEAHWLAVAFTSLESARNTECFRWCCRNCGELPMKDWDDDDGVDDGPLQNTCTSNDVAATEELLMFAVRHSYDALLRVRSLDDSGISTSTAAAAAGRSATAIAAASAMNYTSFSARASTEVSAAASAAVSLA
jgi:hypothetical protein